MTVHEGERVIEAKCGCHPHNAGELEGLVDTSSSQL